MASRDEMKKYLMERVANWPHPEMMRSNDSAPVVAANLFIASGGEALEYVNGTAPDRRVAESQGYELVAFTKSAVLKVSAPAVQDSSMFAPPAADVQIVPRSAIEALVLHGTSGTNDNGSRLLHFTASYPNIGVVVVKGGHDYRYDDGESDALFESIRRDLLA